MIARRVSDKPLIMIRFRLAATDFFGKSAGDQWSPLHGILQHSKNDRFRNWKRSFFYRRERRPRRSGVHIRHPLRPRCRSATSPTAQSAAGEAWGNGSLPRPTGFETGHSPVFSIQHFAQRKRRSDIPVKSTAPPDFRCRTVSTIRRSSPESSPRSSDWRRM